MSTKKKLEEDFFTCVICQEVFQDPVTLHCTHNFCINCITSFTKTKPHAIAEGSLPCPSCRHLTKVPDPKRPVEEWATQLKTGFFVKSLMEAIGTMDTTTVAPEGGQHCSICKKEGKKTPASVRCMECKICICESCQRKHIGSHTNGNFKEREDIHGGCKRKCKHHTEKEVELYCGDCSLVICVLCCSLNHRKCSDVKTVEEAAKMIQPKIVQRGEEAKAALEAFKTMTEEKRHQYDKLALKFASIEEEIDKTSESVTDFVLSKVKGLKDEANNMKEKQCGSLLGQIKSLGMETENLEKDEASIQLVLQSSSEVDMLEMYAKLPKIDPLKLTNTDEELTVQFEGFGQKMIEAIEPINLGRLYIGKETDRVDTRTAKLNLMEEIDIEIPSDKDEPFLRDVLATNLPETNVIIVADSANKCVKSFYGNSEHSFIRLPAGPCKMTKSGHTQGAVTLSNKSVLTFSFSPDLKETTVFRTRKNYYGIAWLGNSTFAMGGLSPVCIDIIDMSGTILKSLSHFVQENLVFWDFQTPVFLCPSPSGNVVVSDYSTRQVTVLNKDLEIEHRFPRIMPQEEGTLRNPLGVACSSNGDIFVVDRSREIVIQLTNEAQFIRNVLTPRDGLEGETCIFVDEKDHLFLAVANRRVKKFSFVA